MRDLHVFFDLVQSDPRTAPRDKFCECYSSIIDLCADGSRRQRSSPDRSKPAAPPHVPPSSYANERFPTEVRATAAAFCVHVGSTAGGFVPLVVTFFAIERHMGFAVPMLIGTVGGLVSFVITLLLSPETKGKVLLADLELAPSV
jgi:hypothetical protein